MTYIVNNNCIRCKTMDCVEVCPVDCFYEGENMLVIHPDQCIDCSVCEPECPVDAIKADTEPGLEKWLSLNAEYAKIWPNITVKKAPPPDWKAWDGKPDKLQYFSPKPGTGELNEGLDSQHDSGVDPMKRVSNTKASPTAAENGDGNIYARVRFCGYGRRPAPSGFEVALSVRPATVVIVPPAHGRGRICKRLAAVKSAMVQQAGTMVAEAVTEIERREKQLSA